ncbi:MAG: GNAT family N-acetyltransferase [Oceanihabitans sp.]
MQIVKATTNHLNDLVILFDAYRVFYKQQSNTAAAKKFLLERLQNNDSIIYIAYQDKIAVGFTQLFPLFSSVSMQSMYLLNDLYVKSTYRKLGIGEQLINQAKQFCITEKQKGLAIQTAFNNPAQKLYQRLGFVKDTDLHFFWKNTKL